MNTWTMEFKKSIKTWDEGLPLGDGKLGSLVYGSGPIRISLDRIDLWDNRPTDRSLEPGFTYKNLIKLARGRENEEDWIEHDRLFDSLSHVTPYPSKITAGRLEIDFGEVSDEVYSHLDLKRAVATVKMPSGKYMKLFNSAVRHVGVFRIYGEYKLDMHIPDYISGDEFGRCALNTGLDEEAENWCMQYPRSTVVKEGEYTYYVQKTHTDYLYTTLVMEKRCGEYTDLYYTVVTTDDGDDVLSIAKAEVNSAYSLGYDNLLAEHIAWWAKYNKLSSVVIPDKEMEWTYNVYNYQFASCSRKGFSPMGLQGVWTADNDSLPPWKGDYHFDTNVQLSYQAYLKGNRLEAGEVIVDYLWNMRHTYKKFAKKFFGVDGYLLPSTAALDGTAIGGWAMYSYAPISTVWAIQSLDEYYLYTGDERFFKNKLYPIFRDTAKAFMGLFEERDGKLYLPLSASPEIYDNTKQAYLEPNTNYDTALLIYLFTKTRDFAKKLGKDYSLYDEVLAKLDPIAIDPKGIIMLDKNQLLPFSHRHFSHVMSIYPLHLINYDTAENKRIIDATIKHLEELGKGWWCGFSFPMASQIYSMAGKGNASYQCIHEYVRFFIGPNGFHLNSDYKHYGITNWHNRPFTLEAQFAFCDALQEMLLQEHEGYINLFPSIPMDWDKLEFKKLRSYGGLLVSAKYDGGKISKLEFTAKRDMTVKIKDKFNLSELIGVKAEEGFITLDIKRGRVSFN